MSTPRHTARLAATRAALDRSARAGPRVGDAASGGGIDLVAIGASAGGVEAVGKVLAGLRPDFPAAVAVVLHVPPDRPSLLADLFAERCALDVKEADDKEPIVSGTVYIAPPNYHLLVEPDASFSLSVEDAVLYSRPSIDLLFETAAYAYGERMVGVVMTGASSDGAAGLKRVRAQGGRAWVQNPMTARSATMPRAALETAGADRILDLDDLAIAVADVRGSTTT